MVQIFISNKFHYLMSLFSTPNFVVKWNTWEVFHSHNISDNQAGAEFKVLGTVMDFIGPSILYNRKFIIETVSSMNNVISHDENNT